MAIRVPNLGLGDGKTGDTELKIRQDYNHNFNDQSNAASRLIGTGAGNVPLVEQIPSLLGTAATKNVGTSPGNVLEANNAFGLGISPLQNLSSTNLSTARSGYCTVGANNIAGLPAIGYAHFGMAIGAGSGGTILCTPFPEINAVNAMGYHLLTYDYLGNVVTVAKIYTNKNTTRDSNGFLKTASPVVDLYSDRVELNQDAEHQGGITFEKLGIGNYLVKGSLGFAQEGWHIETPKDTNGNVLVAVVEKQLENNDLSIKAYAKRFDEETGDIAPNLTRPRDIPDGRFICLRLHELPKEPPTMPTETQPEI